MKPISSPILWVLLIASTLYLPSSFAQEYTQWGLPEGAKARIGKGTINEIAYSPDGTQLASKHWRVIGLRLRASLLAPVGIYSRVRVGMGQYFCGILWS